jgi:hypothetical protein
MYRFPQTYWILKISSAFFALRYSAVCAAVSTLTKYILHGMKHAGLRWPPFEFYNAVCNAVDFATYTRQLYANCKCCCASFGVRPGQHYGLKSSDVSVSRDGCVCVYRKFCVLGLLYRMNISSDHWNHFRRCQQLQVWGKTNASDTWFFFPSLGSTLSVFRFTPTRLIAPDDFNALTGHVSYKLRKFNSSVAMSHTSWPVLFLSIWTSGYCTYRQF